MEIATNYLAHLLLAGDRPLVQLGNLAGDFAKGLLRDQYHPDIKLGLIHHRAIDSYTDKHAIVVSAKNRFPAKRRRVAGILVDLSFDHFLSRHWGRYSSQPIESFVADIHSKLTQHHDLLPPKLQRLAPKMMEQNWLLSYEDLDQLGSVIDRVAMRLSKPCLLLGGIAEIRGLYDVLETDFRRFFPQAFAYAKSLAIDSRIER